LGVGIGSVGPVVFVVGAEDSSGSGAGVETGDGEELGEDGAGVAGCETGAAVAGVGVRGSGAATGPLTVVEDPAGTETSTPPALVSTVPDVATMVVSPVGETDTYEPDPARTTDAIPGVRTS
jgi:hypothetical protein